MRAFAINEIKDAIAIQTEIYPNPANDLLQIMSLLEIENIKIYNPQGNLQCTAKKPGKSMDISFLSPGIYFIKLQDINGNISEHTLIKM